MRFSAHKLARFAGKLILLYATAATATATAQSYPAKRITILAGFTAGGPVDGTARVIGDELSKLWGQPVIIDNRPGANGTIAAAQVAKSPADGYTLLMATRSITMNAALYKLPYDPTKAFVPVAVVSEQANILAVTPTFPARDLQHAIKLFKENPGKYTYASTGLGSIPHLSGELFQRLTGTKVVHVPYKGGASLITDLLTGQVDMSFGGLGTVLGQIKVGKLVPIVVASERRSPLLPEVPSAAEAGVKGYNVDTWYGLLAPAGTPAEVVKKINADVNAVLKKPEVVKRLAELGSTPASVSVEEFRANYDEDLVYYGKLIRELGLKLE